MPSLSDTRGGAIMFYEWFIDLFTISNFPTHLRITDWDISEISKVMFIEYSSMPLTKGIMTGRPYYFEKMDDDTYIKAKGGHTKWLRKANLIRRKKKLKK